MSQQPMPPADPYMPTPADPYADLDQPAIHDYPRPPEPEPVGPKRYPCPDCDTQVFRNHQTGWIWIGEFRCEKHTCPQCHEYLIEREVSNAARHFGAALAAGRTLFEIPCTDRQWPALHQRIWQAGGEFIRIRTADGGWWVITDRFVSGSQPTTLAAALSAVRELVEHWHGPGRPVRNSHGWARVMKESSGQFAHVGRCGRGTDPVVIQEIAQAHGATAVLHAPDANEPDQKVMRMWEVRPQGDMSPEAEADMIQSYFMGEVVEDVPVNWPPTREELEPEFASSV